MLRRKGAFGLIAKVAVAAAKLSFDRAYSYRIPASLEQQALPGVRVMVPFGAGNRSTEGIIVERLEADEDGLKTLIQLLDEQPVLSPELLRLAAFVRQRCFCTMYEAVRCMLPVGLLYQPREEYQLAAVMSEAAIVQQPEYFALTETIADLGGKVTREQLLRLYDPGFLDEAIRWLQSHKILRSDREFTQRGSEKMERIAALAVDAEEALEYVGRCRRRAPLQAAVLELLGTLGEASAKELCYFTGASTQVLRRLEKLGYLTLREQEVLRRPKITVGEAKPLVLSPEQQQVYDGLLAQTRQEHPGVALLYGVTGSGKTSVYLQLIRQTLMQGRTALLLVPEIALTPQMLSLFTAHFGMDVAVLHSSLKVGERYDEYRRIREGKARLVIGTRSAVFAPLQNLGLLILDEEQEHSYKSENPPRYSAREVAIYRGHQTGALVILGSATPSVESMYHARRGDYSLYALRERYNQRALPLVTIADSKQDLKEGNSGSIGAVLQAELERNLAEGQQSILFINRRGSARLLQCMDCGEAPQCPRCSVSLTYHSANGRVMCHYCGFSDRVPERCRCGGLLRPLGFGTQRVEQELRELFPGVEVLRMDADTVTATNPHEKILQRFESECIPILLGTQMVTKGLNFENVTLVGVLDADLSLYADHYRAAENTFSLLAQVIGRAGRGQLGGRAVIQTMTPEHAVLQLAARQDYDAFYAMELPQRELRMVPPYLDALTIHFTGLEESAVREAALHFRTALERELMQMPGESTQLLGPAPASVMRVNMRFRYQLTLLRQNSRLLRAVLCQLMNAFLSDRANRGVSVFIDVNAYN